MIADWAPEALSGLRARSPLEKAVHFLLLEQSIGLLRCLEDTVDSVLPTFLQIRFDPPLEMFLDHQFYFKRKVDLLQLGLHHA